MDGSHLCVVLDLVCVFARWSVSVVSEEFESH